MRGEKQLRVAMMVRGYLTVPRPEDIIYAPIDLAVAIAEGLAKRGHQIDFYAPLGSHLNSARIESLNMRPLAKNEPEFRQMVVDPGLKGHVQPVLWDGYMASEMFRRASEGDYDLLYFHHAEAALPFVRRNPRTPVVYTMNDPIDAWYRELFELYASPNQHFVSISNNQRRDAPDLPYAATVYNGVNPDYFEFSAEAEDYLLIAGRIVAEKGFKEAVQLARTTGERLLIIGPVYPDHQGYFDQYIKPFLSEKILYLGAMEQSQLVRYYQKAKAFITPVQWEEPFGLTTVEAMCCGTPAISLSRGAAPEIIKDGKTGYVVGSMGEMADAIGRVGNIRRADCRKHVKAHFSTKCMVDGYEEVFRQIVAGSTPLGRLRRGLSGTVQRATQQFQQPVNTVRRRVQGTAGPTGRPAARRKSTRK